MRRLWPEQRILRSFATAQDDKGMKHRFFIDADLVAGTAVALSRRQATRSCWRSLDIGMTSERIRAHAAGPRGVRVART